MSVITAIFQAILQAITYIIPVSQSGHASIFHDFAGRADGTVTALTGAVNIGIALGIFAAYYNFFFRYGKEMLGTVHDVIQKRFRFRECSAARRFMLLATLSFVPMVLWAIPLGRLGNSFRVLKATAYNATLLDDGVFIAVLGGLVLMASMQLDLKRPPKSVSLPAAIAVGVCSVFFVPVSGLALIGGVTAVLLLFGVSGKLAVKYSYLLAFPVLLVTGIVQLATADYKSGVLPIVLGIVVAAPVAFLAARVFTTLVKRNYLRYIAYYDCSLGVITAVIGIVQLIIR